MVGLLLVAGVSLEDFKFGLGEAAAVVAMLGFDVGFLLSRKHRSGMSNYQNTTILLLMGWVPAFVLSLARKESLNLSQVSASGWFGPAMATVLNVARLVATNYVFIHMKAYLAGNILLLRGFLFRFWACSFMDRFQVVPVLLGRLSLWFVHTLLA